jgi:hypothetical protein
MESWPGVMTPTECFAALKAGATGLKIFPGSLLGPDGLKAIRAVLPKGTQVYAVGGAGPDNFATWIKASADGFGIGTALYTPGPVGRRGARSARSASSRPSTPPSGGGPHDRGRDPRRTSASWARAALAPRAGELLWFDILGRMLHTPERRFRLPELSRPRAGSTATRS